MTLPPITVTCSHDGPWIASDPLTGTCATAIGKYDALTKLHQLMLANGASMVERRIKFIPQRPSDGAVKRFMDLIQGRAA